eukprot:g428.t1
MSLKFAGRLHRDNSDKLALVPWFQQWCLDSESPIRQAPVFNFRQLPKEDGESNGKWLCDVVVFRSDLGKLQTYTHKEAVTQKKTAQEQSIVEMFEQMDMPLDLAQFAGLGTVERTRTGAKTRSGRGTDMRNDTAALEEKQFTEYAHLRAPPGISACRVVAEAEFEEEKQNAIDKRAAEMLGVESLQEFELIEVGVGGYSGRAAPSSEAGDADPAPEQDPSVDPDVNLDDDEPFLLDLGLEEELGLAIPVPKASADAPASGIRKVLRPDANGNLVPVVEDLSKMRQAPPPQLGRGLVPGPGFGSGGGASSGSAYGNGAPIYRYDEEYDTEYDTTGMMATQICPPLAKFSAREFFGRGMAAKASASAPLITDRKRTAGPGVGWEEEEEEVEQNNLGVRGLRPLQRGAFRIMEPPEAPKRRKRDEVLRALTGQVPIGPDGRPIDELRNVVAIEGDGPQLQNAGKFGANGQFAGTGQMIAAPHVSKHVAASAGQWVDRPGEIFRTFRTRMGVEIPEPIMDIQGLWCMVDPTARPAGSAIAAAGPAQGLVTAGGGTSAGASLPKDETTSFGGGGYIDPNAERATVQEDMGPPCRTVIVEENSFRHSDWPDRVRAVHMSADGLSFLYLNDSQEQVKGYLQLDKRTNNKVIRWDDQTEWEPAFTPNLPEEDEDKGETYGYDLNNSKQNLNQFLQKRKLPINAMVTWPLIVVPGFRATLDIMISPKERLRCSVVSGSKKGASTELAMRVCKMLCRRKVIAKASSMHDKSASDTIEPGEFGLSQHMRGVLRKFVTETCNFSPVEYDAEAPVIDVALKIDAAPWSMSANYESEGAISWSEPRACADPWGSTSNAARGNHVYTGDAVNQQLLQELRNKQSNQLYQLMQQERIRLPIWNMQHEIVSEIEGSQVVLVQGQTGCGKTTQIPQFLLDYYIGRNKGVDCNIIVTQPRRVAAISVAERVAQERGEPLGTSCGYMVRFDQVPPRPSGAIAYMTVGVLLKRLAAGLHGISHVIVDEVHERDCNTDFLLIVLRRLIASNPKLRVVLMSATIDLQKLQAYMGRRSSCRIIDVPGRTFPVTCYYLEDTIELLNWKPAPKTTGKQSSYWNPDIEFNPNLNYSRNTEQVVRQLNENELHVELIEGILCYIMRQELRGGVLLFLAGWDEIARCLKTLRRSPQLQACYFLPLHSQVPKSEQHLVFQNPGAGRIKVVLATNIAETSVTIPDISYVIDTCKCKMKYYRPVHEGLNLATSANRAQPLMSRMDIHWAARHNLTQRMGRAGRTHSGILQELYAIDQFQRLTPLGVQISKLPIEPRMAYAVLLSSLMGVSQPMCLIAAAACYQDPIRQDSPLKQQYISNPCYSDQILTLKILYQLFDTQRHLNPIYCRDNGVNGNVVRIVFDSARQLEIQLQQMGFEQPVRVAWSKQRWDALQLLIAISLDHFSMHQGRRRVWLGPMETGNIQQQSCCADEVALPPEKYYVFEEQTANSSTDAKTYHRLHVMGQEVAELGTVHGNVQCRNVTNTSVVPVILGSSLALSYSQGHLYLDGWMPVRCSFETASLMGALKACMESLVLRMAHTPKLILQNDAPLVELRQILQQVCDSNIAVKPEEEE